MCGICGFTCATEKDQPILQAMCDVISHRGPDGEGVYLSEGIALGHRRLSLIDLEGGAQPLVRKTTTDGLGVVPQSFEGEFEGDEYAIVFNGEIYNYQDLRADLEAQGWEFSTASDTEVLLVSYLASKKRHGGLSFLNQLRGMFAFAIWDGKEKELFCARDFFGIKPFYYTLQNGQFIFASEIKSILEHPSYQREVNLEALEHYLCFQFNASAESFFKGIYKLAPAHCLKVSADGTLEMERYWQPTFNPDDSISMGTAVEDIVRTMQDSVAYHNVADVEVGSFLSSGIDSSYMAACLAKENPDVKTFTVGFGEFGNSKEERDEISWAKELAESLNIANAHHYIKEKEYWSAIPVVQWHMDEPSADPSAIALYFVDRLAATQVKAVLSGEGADEFFGGYRIYQAPLDAHKLSWCPKPLLKLGAKILKSAGIRGASYLDRASKTVEDWYYTNANSVAFSEEERVALLKHTPTAPSPLQVVAPAYAKAAGLDESTRMQMVDMHFWLVEDILLKTDKMSMAHSLESRVPFLDKKVFEVASKMPLRLKVSLEQTKIALRKAAETAIPKDWARKRKLGFPVPVASWLREDRYYNMIKDWFTSEEAKQFFNTEELLSLLEQHKAGKDNSRRIWIIWMFLVWHRIYFVDKDLQKTKASFTA